MTPSFQETVYELCKKDLRYNPDAYFFLVEALDVTIKALRKTEPNHERHLTGKELLEGIKEYALNEFGPLAYTVFAEWGIHQTQDFGEIVFSLVEVGRLGKTETDSREDFKDTYTFDDAFLKPFNPKGYKPKPTRTSRRCKRS